MKIKKTSKVMALVLAVTMVLALMPVMMVSAASFDPDPLVGDGVTSVEGVVGDTTVTFTVNYQMTATVDVDQVTILVTKADADVTYSDPETNTQPSNIVFIDQVGYDETGTFTFVADKPETTATYYVKVGGTDINDPATNSTEIVIDSQGGFTVSGYVQAYTSGATVTLAEGVTTTTDADGMFTFSGVAPADYSLVITAKSALTRTIPVTVAADIVVASSTNKISLMFGDIDASGKIDNSDLLTLKGLFNKMTGVIGFDPNVDLDDSGKIDNSDLLTLKGLFNKTTSNYAPWVIAQ